MDANITAANKADADSFNPRIRDGCELNYSIHKSTLTVSIHAAVMDANKATVSAAVIFSVSIHASVMDANRC